jgi:hypothetical protein
MTFCVEHQAQEPPAIPMRCLLTTNIRPRFWNFHRPSSRPRGNSFLNDPDHSVQTEFQLQISDFGFFGAEERPGNSNLSRAFGRVHIGSSLLYIGHRDGDEHGLT